MQSWYVKVQLRFVKYVIFFGKFIAQITPSCLHLSTDILPQNLSMNEAFKLNQVLKFPGGHLNIQSRLFQLRSREKD